VARSGFYQQSLPFSGSRCRVIGWNHASCSCCGAQVHYSGLSLNVRSFADSQNSSSTSSSSKGAAAPVPTAGEIKHL
jgi:hypothetical protein